MRKAVAIFGVAGILLLSGCSEEVKTREWYLKNPDVLAKVYAACQKSGDGGENCKNANEAEFRIKQKNAPALMFGEDFDKDFEKRMNKSQGAK
ncbi:EexN family lipoprotein [Pseudomonas amygdali pv. morsprunorum]|uniref:EexN family lipoprotein n=1 Tax=Pseudomonas amygdali TaxID=47877 RepID=UPI0028917E68|nr:EexN family lipoprotein [Pseudomonas amygdali]MDT3268701.1 EexN family lipoprotein [Pseudomonas amygdali pv. morsprunorum]